MSHDPLSTLCVKRLTRLLEISCLEDLKILEDCAYVAQNVELEEHSLKVFGSYQAVKSNTKSYSNNHVKKLFKFLSKKETPCVFGRMISENTVEFIIQLINHLKIHADTEGLFRISGNKKRQEELKHILNKSGKLNLTCEDCPYNPHDISGILKQFFGALPEPLLTKQLYDCYQQLAGKLKDMDSVSAKNRKVETLKFLFLMLPPLSRLLLKQLVELLSVVAGNNCNKMTSHNLGVVFAPNIVYTRQPMESLAEFTENVEPFTDLVSFIIENATEVFEVPNEFFEEAKEYLLKIALDKEKDAEVPMRQTFCQQIDRKEFRREAKENTNDALMLLYSEMMNMPDGPVKDNFMEKFQKSYPGTPLFVPKSVKQEIQSNMEERNPVCPSTPSTSSKFSRSKMYTGTPSSSSKSNVYPSTPCTSENVLNLTPKRNKEGTSKTLDSNSRVTNTPSTPSARVKQCLKRLRRRSVEMFKAKQPKADASGIKSCRTDSVSSFQSKNSNMFRSYRLPGGRVLKALKKSVSTPMLSSPARRRDFSNNDDDDCDRRLSFAGEDFKKDLRDLKKDDRPISFTFGETNTGIVNFAFLETPGKEKTTPADKIATPIIRKTLYPSVKEKGENINFVSTPKKSTLLKSKLDPQSEKYGVPLVGKPVIIKQKRDAENRSDRKCVLVENKNIASVHKLKPLLSDITNNHTEKMKCLTIDDKLNVSSHEVKEKIQDGGKTSTNSSVSGNFSQKCSLDFQNVIFQTPDRKKIKKSYGTVYFAHSDDIVRMYTTRTMSELHTKL